MTSSPFDDCRHLLKLVLQVPIRTDRASPLVAAPAERRADTQSWVSRVGLNLRLAARKPLIQNLIAYAIAAAIVCYAARGVSWHQVIDVASHATLWIFVVASLGAFLCWFIGETVLYSRLFSYFHGPTGEIELLPTMAAVYFLQIVNTYVASGAFVLFLHARKRAPWLMAGCTLLFQAYLDALLLAALVLLAIVLVPSSPIRLGLSYAAGALAAGCSIASFFLIWGARLSSGNWLRWIYDRPSMSSFRMAQPSQYRKASRHQVSDRSWSWRCTLLSVRQLSYRDIARSDVGNDAVHCGRRKLPLSRPAESERPSWYIRSPLRGLPPRIICSHYPWL